MATEPLLFRRSSVVREKRGELFSFFSPSLRKEEWEEEEAFFSNLLESGLGGREGGRRGRGWQKEEVEETGQPWEDREGGKGVIAQKNLSESPREEEEEEEEEQVGNIEGRLSPCPPIGSLPIRRTTNDVGLNKSTFFCRFSSLPRGPFRSWRLPPSPLFDHAGSLRRLIYFIRGHFVLSAPRLEVGTLKEERGGKGSGRDDRGGSGRKKKREFLASPLLTHPRGLPLFHDIGKGQQRGGKKRDLRLSAVRPPTYRQSEPSPIPLLLPSSSW